MGGPVEVVGVDVGQKFEFSAVGVLGAVGVETKGLVDEFDTEVRASDTDDEDISELFAGETGDFATWEWLKGKKFLPLTFSENSEILSRIS